METIQIWSGKTEYFDDIVDALQSCSIECEVDQESYVIKVPRKNYAEANGVLMELNEALDAGW